MKKVIIFLFLIIFTAISNQASAQTKRKNTRKPPRKSSVVVGDPRTTVVESPKLSPQTQLRLETFRVVWQTIRDNYFDQTFNGHNWESVKNEFEPRILKAGSDKEAYAILEEMINLLNRSHFAIIPPEVYKEINSARAKSRILEKKLKDSKIDAEKPEKETTAKDEDLDDFELEDDSSAKYGIGLELRLINNQFVISSIEKDSAAEKAGLKTGFIIEKINETSLLFLLERIQFWSPNIKNAKKLLPLEIVAWFLNGEKDTAVNLTFLDENEQEKTIVVKREKLSGEAISIGDDIPKQFLNFETKSLNEDVGYIKFNVFAMPVIEKFCSVLTEFKDKKSLIIDLRGNLGGLVGALYGVTGMLSVDALDLGTQIYKVGSEKMLSRPKAKNFKGKIVILVDNLSISAAEIMSAALQENDRALIVGETTAGEALPAISVKLPTHAVLLYPIANFITHKGNFVEGKGVVPNFQVSLDRKSLLAGKDPQLEIALKVIKEDTAFPKKKSNESVIITMAGNPPPIAKTNTFSGPVAKAAGTPPAPKISTAQPNASISGAEKGIKDEKSQQLIDEFILSIGGEESLKKVETYIIRGKSELTIKTLRVPSEISIYRQRPDKYSEIMKSEALGEIREVHNGKTFFVQSDFGVNQEFPELSESGDLDLFAPIFNLMNKNYFKALTYKGIFERSGRKIHLIEATSAKGYTIAMAFDVETKRLVSYATRTMTLLFEDYRKTEDLTFPYAVTRENLMKIEINEIKFNQKIEEANFLKKENCFDKVD